MSVKMTEAELIKAGLNGAMRTFNSTVDVPYGEYVDYVPLDRFKVYRDSSDKQDIEEELSKEEIILYDCSVIFDKNRKMFRVKSIGAGKIGFKVSSTGVVAANIKFAPHIKSIVTRNGIVPVSTKEEFVFADKAIKMLTMGCGFLLNDGTVIEEPHLKRFGVSTFVDKFYYSEDKDVMGASVIPSSGAHAIERDKKLSRAWLCSNSPEGAVEEYIYIDKTVSSVTPEEAGFIEGAMHDPEEKTKFRDRWNDYRKQIFANMPEKTMIEQVSGVIDSVKSFLAAPGIEETLILNACRSLKIETDGSYKELKQRIEEKQEGDETIKMSMGFSDWLLNSYAVWLSGIHAKEGNPINRSGYFDIELPFEVRDRTLGTVIRKVIAGKIAFSAQPQAIYAPIY